MHCPSEGNFPTVFFFLKLMVRAFSVPRFGDEPSLADTSAWKKDKCSQASAGNYAGQPSTTQANNKELPCLKAINKDNTGPTTVHKTTKGKLH